MTPSEVETMLENLNTRTTAIEQILPTLATKDDVREAIRDLPTKADLKDGLAETLAGSRALFEEVKGDYRLLAEHLANVPTEIRELRERVAVLPEMQDDIRRLTKQGASLKGDIRELAEHLARVSQDLGTKIDQLAQKIDGSPRRR